MLFQNILVPWDGSSYSNHAFKVALDIADKYNSKITGISCIDVVFRGHWYYESKHYKQKLEKQKNAIKNQIQNFEKEAEKKEIPFSFKIFETRSIIGKIVSLTKSQKFDLIVMGSHGRIGLDKLLMGSVANGVTNRVRCPVLLLK